MNPTPSSLHQNALLTNVSIAWRQGDDEFIADKAFPVVPVEKQSDLYAEFDLGDWYRNTMEKRGPATESAGDGWRQSSTAYFADVWALHKDIDDQSRANADSVWQLDATTSEFLARKAKISREVNFATNFMTTGVWTGITTGVASGATTNQVLQWNDSASTPIEDIRLKARTMKGLTGYRGNRLILTEDVYDTLLSHPDILARVIAGGSTSQPARILRQSLAALLEVDEILVMGAIQNTAAEGQTATPVFISTKKALLLHTPKSAGLLTPSAGYTFGWRGYLGGTSPEVISRFRMDPIKADRIEIEAAYAQVKVGAGLGHFFNTIIA